MQNLVLIRHGQSVWNKENRFTGWTNVDLSEQGRQEAANAGVKLSELGLNFNIIYTSVLDRAIQTATIIKEKMSLELPLLKHWRLNERHYGALQGLNKQETADKHGADQVLVWRRSYNTRPPLLDEADAAVPAEWGADCPRILRGESLEDCVERVIPFWTEEVCPQLKAGATVLIAAHGNSLRGLMKHLFEISDEEIVKLEIATGTPIVCEIDESGKALNYKVIS
ncbi:MAG: 2,3-bisphosphoglycerate-dependent phosphoglycerate mutase [Halobacteriovoraceae bacterium]|jgi:2,3-bisphosphoglycerate-dependent phosphoglycerate mutase|nr:2,3-bisphosphoglycerate-dependent phosphoglycerate mutase [Halobacteriovoraceae bacterium]MBT5092691.1 2,3-bisphosphoglycerate-dependent phosphoglycerate mutase [Halobacteriovoraceae bacterium]